MTETVSEFYTWTALGSLGIAAGAVVIIAGGVRKLTGWSHPIVPFITALIIVLGGAYYSRSLSAELSVEGFFKIVLLIMNAFLLFCTAIGGQEVVIEGAKGKPVGEGEVHAKEKRAWFESWIS
jgi:hypothetical protein